MPGVKWSTINLFQPLNAMGIFATFAFLYFICKLKGRCALVTSLLIASFRFNFLLPKTLKYGAAPADYFTLMSVLVIFLKESMTSMAEICFGTKLG